MISLSTWALSLTLMPGHSVFHPDEIGLAAGLSDGAFDFPAGEAGGKAQGHIIHSQVF